MAFCRHSSGLDVDERPFLALAIKVPEAQKSLFRVNSIASKRRLKGRAEKEEKEINVTNVGVTTNKKEKVCWSQFLLLLLASIKTTFSSFRKNKYSRQK